MLDSFCDILAGFLFGAVCMGLFAFGIVPLIERKQREKREIKRLAEAMVDKLEKEGKI